MQEAVSIQLSTVNRGGRVVKKRVVTVLEDETVLRSAPIIANQVHCVINKIRWPWKERHIEMQRRHLWPMVLR